MTVIDEQCDLCLMPMDECECGDKDEADEPKVNNEDDELQAQEGTAKKG